MSREGGPATVAEIREIADPVARLSAAFAERQRLQERMGELTAVVRDAIAEAGAAGITKADLARRVGVSKQRLTQIAAGGHTREGKQE